MKKPLCETQSGFFIFIILNTISRENATADGLEARTTFIPPHSISKRWFCGGGKWAYSTC